MADDLLPFDKRREPEFPETHERKYLTPKQKVALLTNQGGRCAICREKCRAFEYDHVVELWASGTNDFSNWQALCRNCHTTKSGVEAKHRAKMNRLRGKAGQVKRRKERGSSLIKGRNTFDQPPLPNIKARISKSPGSITSGGFKSKLQSRGFDRTKSKKFDGSIRERTVKT